MQPPAEQTKSNTPGFSVVFNVVLTLIALHPLGLLVLAKLNSLGMNLNFLTGFQIDNFYSDLQIPLTILAMVAQVLLYKKLSRQINAIQDLQPKLETVLRILRALLTVLIIATAVFLLYVIYVLWMFWTHPIDLEFTP